VADELLALATEIARQVVRGEVTAQPEIIVQVVQEALAQLPHQHATIFLNPDDASLIRSYMGDALSHAGHRLLEDSRLTPGDCVLESGSSQIDATLATRWRRVVESLGIEHAWHDKDEQ
jgi:flagellar assembly protein FliH